MKVNVELFEVRKFLIRLCFAASFLVSGDTLGSFIYVPCEVIKQRMQIQGTSSSWSSYISRNSVPVQPRGDMYGYYTGMFQAGLLNMERARAKRTICWVCNLFSGYYDVNWIHHSNC